MALMDHLTTDRDATENGSSDGRLSRLPTTDRVDDTALTRGFWLLALTPTLLGAVHHLDHVVRGNHVGWPLIPEVTPFTYSLAIYPLLAVSGYLTVTRRVDAGYWAALFAGSAGLLAFVHVGPWAVEPPGDVIDPYANPLVGYLAFGVLLALIGSILAGSLYAVLLWHRRRSATESAA